MSYLSLNEVLRCWWVRPDVLSTGTLIMQDFERETGRRLYIPKHGGHRFYKVQAQLFADSLKAGGGKKLAWPVADPDGEFAFHVVGGALDFHIVGGRNNNDNPDPDFAKLAEIAERHGMRAGYRFKKRDVFHIEVNETMAVARAKWETLTRERLWRGGLVVAVGVGAGFALAHSLNRSR